MASNKTLKVTEEYLPLDRDGPDEDQEFVRDRDEAL
jgi:hypothetical protein